MLVFDHYRRLEPDEGHDLDVGLRAEVGDALWFLGRQWQLGEHEGEDASSPVGVTYLLEHAPFASDRLADPSDASRAPTEAIVESEPNQWWTPGRRIALGRSVSHRAREAGQPIEPRQDLMLHGLPPPYDHFAGFDGQALWRERESLALSDEWFETRPAANAPDRWLSGRFEYTDTIGAGGTSLDVVSHDGDRLRWYDFRAADAPRAISTHRISVLPDRLRYPGAPAVRWWEIENRRVDIAAFPPDRSHFATLLLIELLVSHSDDWFTFPVPAELGGITALTEVIVRDSFDDTFELIAPTDGWSMFRVDGLPPTALACPPPVVTPLEGPPLEFVDIAIDEEANMAWAVERRINGREVASDPVVDTVPAEIEASEMPHYAYRLSNWTPRGWHPYLLEERNGHRQFVQSRIVDYSGSTAQLAPEPRSVFLKDPENQLEAPVHSFERTRVVQLGVRLERRHVLARGVDRRPAHWIKRRRTVRDNPQAFHIVHDTFDRSFE